MINDIQIVDLKKYNDNRGYFKEFFHANWFPQYDHTNLQMNNSFSRKHVLRGLHYHYHQYDYWYVPYGKLRVALLDIRRDSTTFKQSQFIDTDNSIGIFIPPGIAHGFYALEDSHLIYVVNQYYDSNDDLELNHRTMNIAPGFNYEKIIINERDESAPYLHEIDESTLVFSYR